MVSNISWQELSNNYLLIIAILISNILNINIFYHYLLWAVLFIVLIFNFFILSKGMQRQFILKQDTNSINKNIFSHFLKYWILFRIIRPFLLFNTMSTIYRMLTCKYRCYPDFYFLGPKRSGSTTLTKHLLSIGFNGPYTFWNGTDFTKNKETNYYSAFLGLSSIFNSHSLYRLHFPFLFWRKQNKNTLYFDGDPAYFHLPHVRNKIYATNPSSKFLFIIRDPLKRVISNFKYESNINNLWKECGLTQDPMYKYSNLKQMIEIEQSEFIQTERKKLANISNDEDVPQSVNVVDRFSIIQQSSYGKMFKFWLEKFDKKQFYIIDLKKLNDEKLLHDELLNICKFLEYPISKKEIIEKCKPIHINKQSKKTQSIEIDQESIKYAKELLDKDNQLFSELISPSLL